MHLLRARLPRARRAGPLRLQHKLCKALIGIIRVRSPIRGHRVEKAARQLAFPQAFPNAGRAAPVVVHGVQRTFCVPAGAESNVQSEKLLSKTADAAAGVRPFCLTEQGLPFSVLRVLKLFKTGPRPAGLSPSVQRLRSYCR